MKKKFDNKIILFSAIFLIIGLFSSYFYFSNSCKLEKQEMQEIITNTINTNWLADVQPKLIEYSFLKSEKELGKTVSISDILFEPGKNYTSNYFYSKKKVELRISHDLEGEVKVLGEFPNQFLISNISFKSHIYTCCTKEKCIVSIGEKIDSC